MGLLDKVFKLNQMLIQILDTFAQSIDAVEKNNKVKLNEAWDIFINTAGQVTDSGILTELECETLVCKSAFPKDHSLTLDILTIRNAGTSIQEFVDSNKMDFVIMWSQKSLGNIEQLKYEHFAGPLDSIAKSNFPNYISSESNRLFIATVAIFVLAIIEVSENYSKSKRDSLRMVAYEFALRWIAEINYA